MPEHSPPMDLEGEQPWKNTPNQPSKGSGDAGGGEALGLGTGSSYENKAGTGGGAHEKHCSQLR